MFLGLSTGLTNSLTSGSSTPALVLDLDSTTGGRGTSWTFVRGDSATQLATDNVDITDPGGLGLDNIKIVVSGVQDDANEVLAVGADTFPLNANKSTTELVGGVTFAIGYVTATQTFTITNNAGGKFSTAAAIAFIEAITQVFSGTPTYGSRSFSFTIEADSVISSAAVATVSVVDQAPIIDAIADDTATVGVEKTITPSNSGGPATSWSATGLSDGAAINSSTGVVTWTPTIETTLNITITATNSGGSDDEAVAVTSSTANNAPVIDLNGAGGGINASGTFTEGDSYTSYLTAATLSDADSDPIVSLVMTAGGQFGDDGLDEQIKFDTWVTDADTDLTDTLVVGSTTFQLAFVSATGVLTVTKSGGGTFPAADGQALQRLFQYANAAEPPTEGGRTFSWVASDGTDNSTAAVLTVTVSAVGAGTDNLLLENGDALLLEDGSSLLLLEA